MLSGYLSICTLSKFGNNSESSGCELNLRIVTVNLPVSYLNAIESLTGNEGLYPSRSELIRVAVRDFLIRELESAKSFQKYQNQKDTKAEPEKEEAQIDENYVTIGEKTYKIIKK